MNKAKTQVFEGILSIVANTILFAVKFWVGVITGSIALIAEAWHTLSDSLSSVVVALSVKLQSKKADKDHPFGHGRWEHISSIFVAFMLGIVGYNFFVNSIDRFKNRESVVYGTLAIVVTIISIIIKEVLAQIAFYVGRKTDNLIVKADGWHHRSDALAAAVVLIGMLITKFYVGFWWMDSVLGVLCSLTLFYIAFAILKESISPLLGEEPEKDLVDKINNEIKMIYNDDFHLHHLHLHNYVTQKELTMHLRLNNNMTNGNCHIIATNIEKMIFDKFDIVATIHIEPLE